MIEIPSDLQPELVPLSFLLGTWEGAGVVDFPGMEKANFGQEVTFSHDGRAFLEYHSRTWTLDSEGSKLEPLDSETGYWRMGEGRGVEISMVRNDGIVEIWYGEIADGRPQIDLATDAVARVPAVNSDYSGGKRLYGLVDGDLMWVFEKATADVALRPYMSAHLKKVPQE